MLIMKNKPSKKNIIDLIAKKLKMPSAKVEKLDNFTKIIRSIDIIRATKNVINIFNSVYKPIINIIA